MQKANIMKKIILIFVSVVSLISCSSSAYNEFETKTEITDSKSTDLSNIQVDGYWETANIERNDSLFRIQYKNIYRIEFLSDKTADLEYVFNKSKSMYRYNYDSKNATYQFNSDSNSAFTLKVIEIKDNGVTFVGLITDPTTKKTTKIHFAKLAKVSIDVGVDTGFEE